MNDNYMHDTSITMQHGLSPQASGAYTMQVMNSIQDIGHTMAVCMVVANMTHTEQWQSWYASMRMPDACIGAIRLL